MPGCEIVEKNIQVDHIHMIMVIPPKYAVSDVVGRLKGITASHLRKKFDWLKEVYWKENIVWFPVIIAISVHPQPVIWICAEDSL